MLDKASRRLLLYLRTNIKENYMVTDIATLALGSGLPEDDAFTALAYLQKHEYLQASYAEGGSIRIILEHTALHKTEFAWLNVWQYLIDNLIAILALFIACCALIVSAFSLLAK